MKLKKRESKRLYDGFNNSAEWVAAFAHEKDAKEFIKKHTGCCTTQVPTKESCAR